MKTGKAIKVKRKHTKLTLALCAAMPLALFAARVAAAAVVAIAVASFAGAASAMPSTNNFHAVTNDWYNGNFTNVYELAQMRLAANSNDVVGAYLMLDWHL